MTLSFVNEIKLAKHGMPPQTASRSSLGVTISIMRLLIIVLMFPLSLLSQTIEFEKYNSIQIDTFSFSTYALKIGNYSVSDPAKVFIVPSKSFDSLIRQIPKLYFSKKQEYNEYYVLSVEDLSKAQVVKRAVTEFLGLIDIARIASGRSTFLRVYSWDNINNRFVYQSTEKDLSQVDNMYYLNSTKDLCRYMACPDK